MAEFKFVSHQKFLEDPYTREIVYLSFEDKYRVAFVRRQGKNGGLYWGVMSTAVANGNDKTYFESFQMDSSFLEKDIKNFLEKRLWESKSVPSKKPAEDQDLPF